MDSGNRPHEGAAPSALLPRSGILGLWWQGAAPAPAWGALDALGIRRSRSGPLAFGCWGAARDTTAWSTHGAVAIGFHGEVFNAAELSRALGVETSASVGELLQSGWARWRESLFDRLDGVFAVAVYEPGKLTLCRDRSGLTGLYVHADRGWQLSFATDLPALHRLPGVQRRICRRSLHEYLRFLQIAAPNTIFENVIALEPGRIYTWPPGGPVSERHTEPVGGALLSSIEAATDCLDRYLQQSVEARLADAREPAAFLSGGLDSALVCALASRRGSGVRAVTVGFDLATYDESPMARRIAEHLGMEHEVLRFSHAQYVAALDRLGTSTEQPMADPAALATLLAFDHCRDRHDVVLDGTGADEAVGAMPPRHIRLAITGSRILPLAVRRTLARATQAVPAFNGLTPILDHEHPAETMIPWNGFSRDEIARLCGEPVTFDHTHFYETYRRESGRAHYSLYSALIDSVPCDRLTQAVRITNAHIRYPFVEPRTDSLLRGLPTEFRFRPGEPKRILRRVLERYVPPPIWAGPKHGFNFPIDDFLSRDDFAVVRYHLDHDRWRDWHVVSAEHVKAWATSYMASNKGLTFKIWALVVLSAWLHRSPDLTHGKRHS